MKRCLLFACLAAFLFPTLIARAGDLPRFSGRGLPAYHRSTPGAPPQESGVDTIPLMGAYYTGAPYSGDFELDPVPTSGVFDRFPPYSDTVPYNYWTARDETQSNPSHWHASNSFPVSGTFSAWCGDPGIPSCDGGFTDPVGGYGNNWDDMLEWRQTVTNTSNPTTLNITATADIDCEPGFDRLALYAETLTDNNDPDGLVLVSSWSGLQTGIPLTGTFTYPPGEYMGGQVVLIWRFESDGDQSDEDCYYGGRGGAKLDNIIITSNNGAGYSENFEGGTLGMFTIRAGGVGNFAAVRSLLPDYDPCKSNYSRQVAFIDDGVVVAGTGGTTCQDWCYGQGSFILNTTGGLAGPDNHLHNAIYSPVMNWTNPAYGGARLEFDVFRHEALSLDAPGMFYTWHVKSSATGVAADCLSAPEKDRDLVYYGGPDYFEHVEVLDDLIVPSPTHVQVRLAVYELGWVWGWSGANSTPAPYFDNVRFKTYPVDGPRLAAREIDLAQDGFPEIGIIDMSNPSVLSVRFDMAQNISPPSHLRLDPGDSIVFDCASTRAGATLVGPPELFYTLQKNPVFDGFRTSFPATGSVVCGVVTSTSPADYVLADRFYADLPDTGFLFPGDVLHYYLEASDYDGTTVMTTTLPADLTKFGNFAAPDHVGYNPSYVMRCLPSIHNAAGDQPAVIFWNDFGHPGGMGEWFSAFGMLGLVHGRHYDHYYTNGPSSGIGNGLGGKATPPQLAGYRALLYTSGDLVAHTLSNSDFLTDASGDEELLMSWLDQGGKSALMTGDNLASDLDRSGVPAAKFLASYMGVNLFRADIRLLIGNQTIPRVVTDFPFCYRVYGSCPQINTFDAVTAIGALNPNGFSVRLAQFEDPGGNLGAYPYSAYTRASGVGLAGTSQVYSSPYDFMFIRTDPNPCPNKANASLPARVQILQDVLAEAGIVGDPLEVSGVLPDAAVLTVRAAPNPFNPTTTISYVAPRTGHFSLKVYNVRGQLVRTLIDGSVERGASHVKWDGRDNRGSKVASGVYFYEARQGDEVVINKMALLK